MEDVPTLSKWLVKEENQAIYNYSNPQHFQSPKVITHLQAINNYLNPTKRTYNHQGYDIITYKSWDDPPRSAPNFMMQQHLCATHVAFHVQLHFVDLKTMILERSNFSRKKLRRSNKCPALLFFCCITIQSKFDFYAYFIVFPEYDCCSCFKFSPFRFQQHPRKSTWNLDITCLNRKTIFQTFIFWLPY